MKLLVLDIEGTIFKTTVRLPSTSMDSTIWQAIADALGPEAVREEVETHNKWRSKKYGGYLDWMKDTIRIHQKYGLTADLFAALISSAKYNPGIRTFLSNLNRAQYEVVLISGGFRELAARVQRDFRVIHAFAACEYLFAKDGHLTSYNLLPCDFAGKIDFVRLMLKEYKLSSNDWIFVGDGANDVEIAKAAPVSVAYRAHVELQKIAHHSIQHFSQLPSLLFDQRHTPK